VTNLLQVPYVLISITTPSVCINEHRILLYAKLVVVTEKPFELSLISTRKYLEAHQFGTQRLPSPDDPKVATPHFRYNTCV
jgi:hypothetical protein